MHPSTLSDDEIADGLASGSALSFRALYEAQGRSVLGYLMRMTGRREMAEELTQETFLMVIRKIGFYRKKADGGLKAWVFRIATHLAIDALRREKTSKKVTEKNVSFLEPVNSNSPMERFERGELGKKLQSALMKLNDTQRQIFLLKEQEEMNLLEISRVCGCSENAVKQKLFRIRTTLRKILCE